MNLIKNWIGGEEKISEEGISLEKFNPHNGQLLSCFVNSTFDDINNAIEIAQEAFQFWAEFTPVKRGQILGKIAHEMRNNLDQLASCISMETGKSIKDALGEVQAAILQAEFFAGEGMRLYGKSLTSGIENKYTHTVRQPHGVVGLIVPANTPIANIAWKTFPALICGNSVVLKASEDSPAIAILFAKLTKAAGLPDGVFNVIQGEGIISGSLIVEDPRISLISFTGSTIVGKKIAQIAGNRLARVSLELGGKNPFVVCDDADIDQAVHWATLSAFSNAGQRCAAGSRILVYRSVYNSFRDKFVARTKKLKLGVDNESDLGPIINKKQQINILNSIENAIKNGGKILCGGRIPIEEHFKNGYYIEPTIIDEIERSSEISQKEIFGPVATLHVVDDLEDALRFSNSSKYGLTAAIHTRNIDRSMWFAQKVKAGIVNVNIGTFGSEPHMPFGGLGLSGNGTREPGVEALDVYSELKCISVLVNKSNI
jgi:acyl-CoA reductase-like NAD-dependent aldehyde dehydrogenase